jgi:hypothetical protein
MISPSPPFPNYLEVECLTGAWQIGVRFRLLQGGGLNADPVFELYGHFWAEPPSMSEGIRGCTPSTTHANLYR